MTNMMLMFFVVFVFKFKKSSHEPINKLRYAHLHTATAPTEQRTVHAYLC